MAAAPASFSTWIDRMSFGLISCMRSGTPSTRINGVELPEEVIPRINTVALPPGCPVVKTVTPDACPWRSDSVLPVGVALASATLTTETDPVISRFRWAVYPVTTTSFRFVVEVVRPISPAGTPAVTGTSRPAKPTALITSVAVAFGSWILKEPSIPVWVRTLVPLTWTVAPGTGLLSVLLITFPVTGFWAKTGPAKSRSKITSQADFLCPFFVFGISSRCLLFQIIKRDRPNKTKFEILQRLFFHHINTTSQRQKRKKISLFATTFLHHSHCGTELLTKAICLLSGDQEGALIVPWPP